MCAARCAVLCRYPPDAKPRLLNACAAIRRSSPAQWTDTVQRRVTRIMNNIDVSVSSVPRADAFTAL